MKNSAHFSLRNSLIFAFAAVAVSYAGMFCYFLNGLHYLPVVDDETIYYRSAKLFSETNSLVGESYLDEYSSILLHANWYGIAYSLFYGGIAKFIGFNNFYFIFLNLVLVCVSLWILFRLKTSMENKLSMVFSFLGFNMVFGFTFTYFPEILNLFFGVCLISLVIRIYRSEDHLRSRLIFLFVCLTVLFSFFRVTWIFWLTALVPFAESKKEMRNFVLLFFAGLAITFAYMHFFCARYISISGELISNLTHLEILKFCRGMLYNGTRNVYYFFVQNSYSRSGWIVVKWFYPVMAGHVIYESFRNKNKLFRAMALVMMLTFLVLFTIYNASYPYFMKITASLFVFYFVTVFLLDIKKSNILVLLVILCSFPGVFAHTIKDISNRKKAALNAETICQKELGTLKEISPFFEKGKAQLVQCCWYDLNFQSRVTFLSSLPTSTPGGFPVSYTFSVFDQKIPYDSNYVSSGRMHIDFILSGQELRLPGIALVLKNDYFYFYKRSDTDSHISI